MILLQKPVLISISWHPRKVMMTASQSCTHVGHQALQGSPWEIKNGKETISKIGAFQYPCGSPPGHINIINLWRMQYDKGLCNIHLYKPIQACKDDGVVAQNHPLLSLTLTL
jgi:hypothetical protein